MVDVKQHNAEADELQRRERLVLQKTREALVLLEQLPDNEARRRVMRAVAAMYGEDLTR